MRNSSPVILGEIIADKYQVEGVIGEGGMGLVVSAWHLGLRQRVAIKFLLTDGGRIEEAALERFQREARAAAGIRSEHVCRTLDVGMLPSGAPYLVMEYLEGCDLADELARRGRIPPAEAIGYVLEACEALAEAHVAGIVHRDLKPANLYLARRPNGTRCLKLLDFGVSKSLADGSLPQFALTKTSSLIGSPIYMSPEQLNSAKDVDARTDIWALGALTYELLTGRPPFYGESIPQLVNQVLHAEPASFAELGLTAPAGLEAALRKALEKQRERRHQSVGELALALGPYAPDDSISVSRILRIRGADREPLPETVDDRERIKTPRSGRVPTPQALTPPAERSTGRSKWAAALLGALLVLLTGLAALLSRTRSVPPEPPESAALAVSDGGAAAAAREPTAAARAESVSTTPPAGTIGAAVLPTSEPRALVAGDAGASTAAGSITPMPTRPPASSLKPSSRPPKPAPAAPQPTISDFGGRR